MGHVLKPSVQTSSFLPINNGGLSRMLANQKFTMRITPEERDQLTALAAKMGRTKSGALRCLLREASKVVSEQQAVIFKSKKKPAKTN